MVELAAVAALGGDAVVAARLFGAADSVLAHTGGTLAPDSQRLQDRAVASGRGRVTTDVFDAAWAEGREWGLERALAYAVEAFPDA